MIAMRLIPWMSRVTFLKAKDCALSFGAALSRALTVSAIRRLGCPNTVQKIEPRDNKFYLIIAKRFENAGRHCVIEMLDTIDEEEIEKVRTDTSLLDAIRSANAALYSELYRDDQPGIYNRRFFEERFDSLENVTAIAMIDIDGFKEVNDTMGHHAGDVILRAVVEATKKSIRETDFFIRLGGDEGLIAFVGMKRESFASCLEKIRQAVNDLVVPEFPTVKLAVTSVATSANPSPAMIFLLLMPKCIERKGSATASRLSTTTRALLSSIRRFVL